VSDPKPIYGRHEDLKKNPKPPARFSAFLNTLPKEEGFFWWRENEKRDWRMVQIVAFASCNEDTRRLMTYDVHQHSWGGRSMKMWADYYPAGQWIPIYPPDAPRDRLAGASSGGPQ